MTTPLPFTHWTSSHSRYWCIWNDEYHYFPTRTAATAWARRQGCVAVFAEAEPIETTPDKFRCIDCGSFATRDVMSWGLCPPCQDKATKEFQARADEPRGIEYRFLGVMDLGEEA
jgi:hypothetical protein